MAAQPIAVAMPPMPPMPPPAADDATVQVKDFLQRTK